MKKFLSTLAVLLAACLLLCSCGKKTKCSGQAVSVGKSAIEAADDYLDNNQSAHDALDRLDELKEKMEYVDSEDASKPTHSADYSVSSDLVLLSHEITFDSIDHDRYDKILEKRREKAQMRSDRQAFNGPPVFAFSAQIPSPQLKAMCKMWKTK